MCQPVHELSVDKRTIKRKASTHMIIVHEEWVLADPSGFTCLFNIYTGKMSVVDMGFHTM